MGRRFALSALLCSLACGGPTGRTRLDRVPEGPWGGDHVALAVAAEEAQVEFDCAHGRIDGPLALDGDGRFRQGGTFVQEHGGPVTEGPEDRQPAVYSGVSDGRRLIFFLTLTDQAQTLGPFTVLYGAPPRLFKCLLVGPVP